MADDGEGRDLARLAWRTVLPFTEDPDWQADAVPGQPDWGGELVGLLRSRSRNLAHPDLIDQWWPGIGPGGPAARLPGPSV